MCPYWTTARWLSTSTTVTAIVSSSTTRYVMVVERSGMRKLSVAVATRGRNQPWHLFSV